MSVRVDRAGTPPSGSREGRVYLILAWVSTAALPVCFVAANMVAELVVPPTDAPLIEGLAAAGWILMFGAGVLAAALGLAARRRGWPAGIYPALIGGILAGSQALLLVLGLLGHFVRGLE